jgi:arginine:ornithine antiporter/lysine permease
LRYARKRSHVGKATVLGFLSVLALFESISLLSYAILPGSEIAALPQPSVGAFIRVGLIVSVLGAYPAWQLLAADVVYAAAKDNGLPTYFSRSSSHGGPANAVLRASILVTFDVPASEPPYPPHE